MMNTRLVNRTVVNMMLVNGIQEYFWRTQMRRECIMN